MNEHYKLLAEQATDWCLAHCAEFDTNAWQWERKFAELVIEDCTGICSNLHYNWRFGDEPDSTSGPKECAHAIKQHFGIKE